MLPRVRSQPLEAAVTTIPYETIAAFMSKPSVLEEEQIKASPYVLSTRDSHVVMSEGNTVYARGFTAPVELGAHYNLVRVGEPLRDPDDNRILGYNGVYTGSGHVTRGGDPATLIMTQSTRETYPGDKLLPGDVDVPLDFMPSPPKVNIKGRIMRYRTASPSSVSTRSWSSIAAFATVCSRATCSRSTRQAIPVYDNSKNGFVHPTSTLFAKKVELPDERTGTFMVFKTFDRMSFGLIMEATDVIHVADKVQSP